jgi:hypothetical protein
VTGTPTPFLVGGVLEWPDLDSPAATADGHRPGEPARRWFTLGALLLAVAAGGSVARSLRSRGRRS